jgi:peptidoglycan/LPS O-acetylase OafA/YrhL
MTLFADVRPGWRRTYPALNLIRLVAALMVYFAHCWQLTGRLESWNAFLGRFAVDVFFIVSGFLIAKSWETCANPRRYAINRVLRVFPALAMVVLFSTFVLGPSFTDISQRHYFSDPLTYRYLLSTALIIQYRLPGVFTHNPQSHDVNDPLWTLPYEAGLYVLIAVIGVISRPGLRFTILAAYVLLLALNLVDAANWFSFGRYVVRMDALEFAAYFFAGATVWVFRKNFVFRWYLTAVAILILAFRSELGCDGVIWFIALPYAVLWLGLRDAPSWGIFRHLQRNDYSYGTYIWGMPIQQAVVAIIGPASLFSNLVLALVVVAAAAYLSWHLLEKHCLALKSSLFERSANTAADITAASAAVESP